tara:strand:- start:204 stop:944 length:741 start_codon:yes stop_codon:yes gene_type:complete
MSSLKHSLDSVASASGGVSKVSHSVSILNDLQDVLSGLTYLEGDMQEGDIVFWLGTGCHASFNLTTKLYPSFHNQLFTLLSSDYSGGTYKSSLAVHYHVLTTASKGMLIGFLNNMANNYSSPVNFLYVVRGVDPNSITSFEETRRTTTAKPTFPAIDISSNDYILAMTASGSNNNNYLPFLPSAGYDDFVSQASGGLGNANYKVASGILLRKPGVSGSYTEPTWNISGTNQTVFTNTSLVIKLSPL